MTTVGQVAPPPTVADSASKPEEVIVDFFSSIWSEAQTKKFFQGLTPEQKSTLLERIRLIQGGSSSNTAQTIAAAFGSGMGADQVLKALSNGRLFDANGNLSGLLSDPVADVILKLMIVLETLGVDLKKLKIKVSVEKKSTAYHAADNRFEGAKNAFIVSMASAGFTVTVGVCFAAKAASAGADASQWFSPITVQLLTAPLSSVSEYQRAQGDLQGSKEDANAQFVGDSLEQITQFAQSLMSLIQSTSSAIAS